MAGHQRKEPILESALLLSEVIQLIR